MSIWQWWLKQNERRVLKMSGLYMWLRSTFSSLPEESDSPEASSATADDSLNCQIYSDALEQAGLELDEVVNRIGDLMSQFWECR
ncbi:MAG: hypothetical protein ACK6EB_08655, partial [Planctomyces sp.]